ncbi:hypothetical protein Tco_0141011, partial [Tanacetum coccineum]
MSSASSAVTYTSVYTDSEPGRVFWGADEEISDGGSPRVIVLGYDGLPIQPVAPPSPDYIPGPEEPQTPPVPQDEDEREPMFIQPHDPDYVPEPIYPEYIPLEDEHEFPAEEQPLPPVVSPTCYTGKRALNDGDSSGMTGGGRDGEMTDVRTGGGGGSLSSDRLAVMAALVISISLDVSVESVGSSFPRVILIGSIPVEVPVAPEVRAAAVASPARVLELDTHSSSKVDPSKSSPPLVDKDVDAGIDAGIDMEVDIRVDVEDEVESGDRGTIEVGVDVVAGIDIPDAMLMPDAVEHLEQVEEGLQDIYDHVIEIPLQKIKDNETGQRKLELRSLIAGGERASLLELITSLERCNVRIRGTMMMERARANRFWRRMRFMESELRQICRFRYYDMMRFRRLETFA